MHELDDTITRLRKIIKKHKADLTGYEALTRSALIDPMLLALGWDVTDPDVVQPEHPVPDSYSGTSYADYVLFAKPKIISVVIEAKALDAPDKHLKDAHTAAGYKAGRFPAPYFAITDGNLWEMYRKDSDKDPVMKFCLADGAIPELYSNVLFLWRKNLGKRLFPINTQKVTTFNHQPTITTKPHASPQDQSQPLSQGWVPLTAWNNIWSSHKTRPPFIIQLPDRTQKNAPSCASIARHVIDYLDQHGLLGNLKSSPVKEGGKQLFAKIEPPQNFGKKSTTFHKATNSGLYFYLNLNASSLIQATIILLRRADQNPDDVHLKACPKT